MDGFQVICTIFVTVVAHADLSGADHEYMVMKAESKVVPLNFDTNLFCAMNIVPDKFQWKFYPLAPEDVFNQKGFISLTTSNFEIVPPNKSKKTGQEKRSDLTIKAHSTAIAGDYQCLAHYGASVVASVPWRVTIQNLGQFSKQENIDVTVVAGNTINWRCELPDKANPEPYIDYYHNGKQFVQNTPVPTKFLVIPHVTTSHSGKYTCSAYNSEKMNSPTFLNLKVVASGRLQAPKFLMWPKRIYTITKGASVFMECAAVGNPVPQVVWLKKNGTLPEDRSKMVEGGLIINNVEAADEGVYECNFKNSQGRNSSEIILICHEPPKIDCLLNSTDVKQGDSLDLDCSVTGVPKPEISWFLNGFSVANDSKIEAIDNKIYFRTVEKRHAGNLQIFARNVVETVYSSISLKVIPLSTTQESSNDRPVPPTRGQKNHQRKRMKHAKMYPPSKPNVTRVNDEAVVVRWTVQSNKGLPIKFFKVQYKELGPANQHDHHPRSKPSKWMTTNANIPSYSESSEVNNLKPDHWYKFRIAAVYSNDDNKNSQNSEKFHLMKLDFDQRNPLPTPLITKTEPINTTAVRIHWKCDTPPNVTFGGFYINYNDASSAADYLTAPVNGQNTSSYVLSHLQPDTVYDIKLQSFNQNFSGEYSSIMKVKTLGVVSTTVASIKETTSTPPVTETAGISKLYIIIAATVLGSCVIVVIIGFFFCRKWKQKKNSSRGDRDKSGVDEHHIQADGNEYVVGPKGTTRSNGCVPSNRITITANPLADADNKNQNMIEMSCLSSQNNNCSTVQPSVSGEDSPTNSRDKKNKNREKRIRNKNIESSVSGENYV